VDHGSKLPTQAILGFSPGFEEPFAEKPSDGELMSRIEPSEHPQNVAYGLPAQLLLKTTWRKIGVINWESTR